MGDKYRRIGSGQAMDNFECHAENFGIYFSGNEEYLKDLGQVRHQWKRPFRR